MPIWGRTIRPLGAFLALSWISIVRWVPSSPPLAIGRLLPWGAMWVTASRWSRKHASNWTDQASKSRGQALSSRRLPCMSLTRTRSWMESARLVLSSVETFNMLANNLSPGGNGSRTPRVVRCYPIHWSPIRATKVDWQGPTVNWSRYSLIRPTGLLSWTA